MLALVALGDALLVGGLISDRADAALARELQEDGVRARVTAVEVFRSCTGRYCYAGDEVAVELRGERRTLRGVDASALGDVPVSTWTAPPAGSRYAAPLRVRHDADDPRRVMAEADVAEHADGGPVRWSQTAVLVAALLTVLTLAACVLWFVVPEVSAARAQP